MITSIEINNYKGIEDFKLNSLNRINLFIGDNNSGKTSFLEASYIGMKDNYIGCSEVLRSRNLNPNFKTMKTLFKDMNLENKIQIKIQSNTDRIITEINALKDKKNFIVPENISLNESIPSQENNQYLIKKNNKEIIYNFGFINDGNGVLKPVTNIEVRNNKGNITMSNKNIYYISSKTRMSGNFANELREQIKSRNEKKKIVEELRLFDSKIEDIIVDGLNIEIYLKNIDTPLPIQAMGAGSFTILEMASLFGRKEINNIFIDEIEDGLHIKSMEIVAKYISNIIEQKPELQLFITTHSLEIIKLITKYQKNKNLVSAFRIYNKNNKTEVVKYEEDLFETLEEGWEIR